MASSCRARSPGCLWRGFYLSFLPGFAAKFRVGLTWMLNSVMPPNIVQIQSTRPATRYIHYRKGDKVFEPGMLIDGFYTVIKGALQTHHRQCRDRRAFREGVRVRRAFRRAGAGASSALRTGLVVALEDGVLLFIEQKALHPLRPRLPVPRELFQGLYRADLRRRRQVVRAGLDRPQGQARNACLSSAWVGENWARIR